MTAIGSPAPESPGEAGVGATFAEGFESEVLERVRARLRERGATRDLRNMPQAMLPLDAREIEALEYFPWKRMVGSKEELSLRDLLRAPADAFIARCYRLLLGRDPTPLEAERGEARILGGLRRLALISALRWSEEGRRFGVPLVEIVPRPSPAFWAALVARLTKNPFRRRKS